MKTEISFYLFIASQLPLIALILANMNSQSVTIKMQTPQDTKSNQKLESRENFAGRSDKEVKTINNNFSTFSNIRDERFGSKVSSYSGNTIESEPAYQILQPENEFSETERSRYLNLPTIQRNTNYLQQLMSDEHGRRKFYTESYYPDFYHRTQFNDLERNRYYRNPYPKAFYNRNFNKRFMDRRRHPKFLLENRDIMPDEEEIVPLYSKKTFFYSKDMPLISLLPVASNTYEKLSTFSPTITVTVSETEQDASNNRSEKSSTKRKSVNRTIQNAEKANEITSNLNKDFSRSKDFEDNEIKKQTKSTLNDPAINKNETLYSHSEGLDLSNTNESEENGTPFVHIVQIRFGRNNARDDRKQGSLNKLPYNRVYFEKIPSNVNFSWFVYVNCSRDRCLLSNTTNEFELLNGGWILHNCTHYGCSEMYPQTESVQKFIGLILLVFSVCVLKIIAFLLMFYYCRHIKLYKSESHDEGEWDEDTSNSKMDEKESHENKHDSSRIQAISAENFEPSPPNQKENNSSTVLSKNKESEALKAQKSQKDDLNIWAPSDQKVIPCLINSALIDSSILIPQKAFEKKVHEIKTSATLNHKKKDRINIPGLEKRRKITDVRMTRNETKNHKKNPDRHTPKRTKLTPGGEGEILLMNLHDEVNDSDSCNPANIVEAPRWVTLLENECKDFISIDLSEEKYVKS